MQERSERSWPEATGATEDAAAGALSAAGEPVLEPLELRIGKDDDVAVRLRALGCGPDARDVLEA